MEKKLVLSEADAKRLYPTASSEMKVVFETSFGKSCFLSIDNVKDFGDILNILGEIEELPHINAQTVEEKSDNALWKLRRICKAYNATLSEKVDRNNTKQYKYFPYMYLGGGSRVLYVFFWYCSVYFPAGLDFLSKTHAEKVAKLFKPILEDYYGIKL